MSDDGKETVENLEALAITGISTALGFPVPPTIAKSVFHSVSVLVTSTADLGAAWLQSKAKVIRAEGDARAELMAKTVKVAAKKVGEDEELAERATLYIGGKMLREQKNREGITREALGRLGEKAPQVDAPKEIEDDWLQAFAQQAERATTDVVRTHFARVLEAEIRSPGAFSPEALYILGKLSPDTARLFRTFCSLCTRVGPSAPLLFTEPVGEPGGNAFVEFGLSYEQLCRLRDAGLVRPDMTAIQTIAPVLLVAAQTGGEPLYLQPPPVAPGETLGAQLATPYPFKMLHMTAAGVELFEIVEIEAVPKYRDKLIEWARRFQLEPRPPKAP